MWDRAEQDLRDAVHLAGRDGPEYQWEELPGEGAFYSPKLEFHLTDAIGRTWQVGTLQLDYVMPELLGAFYIGEDGEKHVPVMLHRAIIGTFERFLGILISTMPGASPLAGLSSGGRHDGSTPTTMPARSRQCARRPAFGSDLRNEKINYKVREHSLAHVPYLLVVGKREAEEGTVAVRPLGADARQEVISVDELIARLRKEALPPDLRDQEQGSSD
jgi:threonyl-tRNA synthetase